MGIVAILAAVAAGPVAAWREKARINSAMENIRTINMLLGQYAIDNDNTYPVGAGTTAPGKSEGIARNLLQDKYASDPAIFALGSAARYNGKGTDFSDFTAANISWDFTAGATASTGITSSSPDLLPTVFCTGEIVNYPTSAGTGLNLTLSGNGPFRKKGIAVAYKGNNAAFITGTVGDSPSIANGFISSSFSDSTAHTQLRP